METKIFTGTPTDVQNNMNQWLKAVKGMVKIISITSTGNTFVEGTKVREWTQVVIVFTIKAEGEDK